MCKRGGWEVNRFLSLLWLCSGIAASADQELTLCTDAELQSAVAAGGTIRFACNGTVALSQTLTISGEVVLDASGHEVVLDGGNALRLIEVLTNSHLSLISLGLSHGKSVGTPENDGKGGAVLLNGGSMSVSNCVFSENLATSQKFDSYSAAGGAIFVSYSTLSLVDCRFSGNQAIGATGRPAPGNGNTVGSARGGALFQRSGTTRIVRTRFDSSLAEGGKIQDIGSNGAAYGGAIYIETGGFPATMTLDGCRFDNNTARVVSADSRNASLLPAGGGAVYLASTNVLVGLVRCQFEGNTCLNNWGWEQGAPAYGGAIGSVGKLTVQGSRFTANTVIGGITFRTRDHGYGGAVWSSGQVTIETSTFDGNSATGHKGLGRSGYPLGSDGSDGLGGALYLSGRSRLVQNSFAYNRAVGGAGADVQGQLETGGGNGHGGAVYADGSVSMVNCTLFGNFVIGGAPDPFFGEPAGNGSGGGIFVNSGAFAGTNLTLVANVALTNIYGQGASGGSIAATAGTGVTLANSIVAGISAGGNCEATFIDSRNNLGSDGTCGFGSSGGRDNLDSGTGTYGDNGGPTPTIPLLSASPAIDAGSNLDCPLTDQRGRTRPGGPGCDIGAFEVVPTVPPTFSLAIRSLSFGSFIVSCTGPPSASFVLEGSADLAQWTGVLTNQTDGNGRLEIDWRPAPPAEPIAAEFLRLKSN